MRITIIFPGKSSRNVADDMDFDYNYDNHLANKMAGKNIPIFNIFCFSPILRKQDGS